MTSTFSTVVAAVVVALGSAQAPPPPTVLGATRKLKAEPMGLCFTSTSNDARLQPHRTPVNTNALSAGVNITLALPSTGVPVTRLAVTATPHLYQDNFTSPTIDTSWLQDCAGSCPSETISTTARPGYLRFNSACES